MNTKAPWLSSYENVPAHLEYPDASMVEMVERAKNNYPNIIAYDFMGNKGTYKDLCEGIDLCAKSLKAMGISEGDKVTICLPNCPQALFMFYGLNKIGALANMIHPLSSEGEIEFYLSTSDSVAAITMDLFYPKFAKIKKNASFRHLIIASVKDALPPIKKLGYSVTSGRKVKPIPTDAEYVILWKDFLEKGKAYTGSFAVEKKGADPAVILYSGGTTGHTKGILLSNLNFNALALQTGAAGDCIVPGHKMLSIMPMFHGFGLGVCIHTMLITGCTCILVPQFTVETYAKLLKKHHPNYIAGVPTLYEALLRTPDMQGVDLSCLEGVFSGGDSLSIELKKKADKFLKDHGANIQIREGYGTTECVTASCLTPKNDYREGSIGIPFPDTYYKIVIPGTTDEAPYGTEGEICLSGPTVMLEYINEPEETADTLKTHSDGRIWLHTGDLGTMDEEGFIYFRQRLKRMIVSSGYNIYPSQLENIIDSHEAVLLSTVIGVDDPYKMQKVKAFIVLRPEYEATDEIKADIEAHCKRNIAKYALPYEYEYRKELPKTLVGKVAYKILEEEERQKESQKSWEDSIAASTEKSATIES